MKEMHIDPERVRKLRLLTVKQRFDIMVKCTAMARQIIANSVQAEHPDWTEAESAQECRRRWAAMTEAGSDALNKEIERRGWMAAWIDEAVQQTAQQMPS